MGYDTDFTGQFNLDKPLRPKHAAYLKLFSETRRMKRNHDVALTLPDPVRVKVGLPIGVEACYFTGGLGDFGQGHDASIVDYNGPPQGQPGLWCKWVPGADGKAIVWSGAEKFYDYTEWLEYLIGNFLAPWGYSLSGEVAWQGEDNDDCGVIYAQNNKVEAVAAKIRKTIRGPSWRQRK